MGLIRWGKVTLGNGKESNFQISCDGFDDETWDGLARIVADQYNFSKVVGVEPGGIKFAKALEPFVKPEANVVLIVDGVLSSAEDLRREAEKLAHGTLYEAVVVFSRMSIMPYWVSTVFQIRWPFGDYK